MIFEDVSSVLKSTGSKYALIGGRAVMLRGYPRLTQDYDFLTADRRVMERSLWQKLEDAGATRPQDVFDAGRLLRVSDRERVLREVEERIGRSPRRARYVEADPRFKLDLSGS
jgi:hypothetical protein